MTEVYHKFDRENGSIRSDSNNLAVPLEAIPYIDHPEITINKHESTEMPFRYVKGKDGQPIMPEVRAKIPLIEARFQDCS